jgi:hypothetical protein
MLAEPSIKLVSVPESRGVEQTDRGDQVAVGMLYALNRPTRLKD